jgi:5'-3' exonuclease
MPGPLLVVDAPSLMYRAFHALPRSITGPEGTAVNALLGTANLILQAIEKYDPRAVVLAFGAEAADYRVELYDGYHADRPEMPDDLQPQWADARAFFEAFGWTVLSVDDLEADDLLGSLATIETAAGGSVLLFTGDRDMFQCVGDSVTVLWPAGKGETEPIGVDEVRRRYGVEPAQVPDFIALRGDPSDGLPGAKGIGAKTAADLLKRKGDLEHVILGAIREKPAVRRALIEQADELRSFRDIATLRTVPVDLPPDTPTDYAGGAAAAAEIGMGRLAKRLEEAARG